MSEYVQNLTVAISKIKMNLHFFQSGINKTLGVRAALTELDAAVQVLQAAATRYSSPGVKSKSRKITVEPQRRFEMKPKPSKRPRANQMSDAAAIEVVELLPDEPDSKCNKQ